MWPPLELATRISDVSSITFFISLVVGLVSTGLIIWMGYVKEHHWDALREQARVKTAVVESETVKAHAEIEKSRAAIAAADARAAKAHAEAERAKAEAAKASLELAKFKAPRTLSAEQQGRLAAAIRPWAGQQVSFSVTGEPEALTLMQVLRRALSSAGWVPIASQTGDIEMDGAGVVAATGVEIQVAPVSAKGTKAAGGANALARWLAVEGIAAQATSNPQLKSADAINVLVGKKPN